MNSMNIHEIIIKIKHDTNGESVKIKILSSFELLDKKNS